MRFAWIIVGAIFWGSVAWAQADAPRTINVTGVGEVQAVPDMAVISLAVTHEDAQASVAMDRVSTDMRAMMERLAGLGIEARDIQTDRFSLRPVWDHSKRNGDGPPKITGFVASNGLTVRVRAMDTLGTVLDAVIREGANDFSGLRFTLQDPKPQQDAARAAAVSDALDRAQQLAKAAGVTLGPIRTISEHGGQRGPVVMEMAAMSRSADVPVAAGEVGVSASVSIVFDILQ